MSNITIASTTSSQEELEHAAGPNWREPYIPKEPPAEPATDDAPLETEAAPETAKSDESEAPRPSTRKNGWEKRIDKLTARNAQLAKELEEARKAKPAEPTPASEPVKNLAPQLKDFKTPEEWADARDAWKEQKAEEEAKAADVKATFDEYWKGVEQAHGKYDDFDEVVKASPVEMHESVKLAIVEMGPEGADVVYYLAKHPEIGQELFELRPLSAVRRLEKIVEEIKGTRSPEPKPKAALPKPIAPVGGTASRSSVPLDQMSPSEYVRVRNKQERRQ